jgi:hypothetical protein
MIIAPRRLAPWAAILSFDTLTVFAAAQEPVTALDKQLDRVNLAVSASGILNRNTSGPNAENQTTTSDAPSNTVGALIDIQYIKSPLVGLEFNVNYSKYVQNFTYAKLTPGPNGPVNTQTPLGIQNDAIEYSLGWVFHTPKILGIGTFVSAGAGATNFVPTRGGGLEYQNQARATYYYSAGFEQRILSPHFGVRASFRQAFFIAPDFETPFLKTVKHTFTTEPNVGFFLHF